MSKSPEDPHSVAAFLIAKIQGHIASFTKRKKLCQEKSLRLYYSLFFTGCINSDSPGPEY